MSKEKIRMECFGCDAKFTIIFNADEIRENPSACPFCGEDIIDRAYEEDSDGFLAYDHDGDER